MYRIIFVIALAVQPFLIQPTVIKDEIGRPRYEPAAYEPIEKPKYKPEPFKKPLAVAKPKMYEVSGSKQTWLRQAGIPSSEWKYVDYIVQKEAGWNPLAFNQSSGACSLAQALPCSKIKGNWRDPVVALKWQFAYVKQRYGGYRQAYNFWTANNWY